MLSIRRINPMARAIGTMGAVAALVGGITFANLTSNTVALSPNTLSSASAQLAIAEASTCPGGDTSSIPGLNTALVPGVASTPRSFCLDNKSSIPLTITAQIPTDFTGSQIPPNQVTLTLVCSGVGTLSGTLDQYSSPVAFGSPLGAGTSAACTETATLAASYSGAGNQTVKPFDVNFVGNQ